MTGMPGPSEGPSQSPHGAQGTRETSEVSCKGTDPIIGLYPWDLLTSQRPYHSHHHLRGEKSQHELWGHANEQTTAISTHGFETTDTSSRHGSRETTRRTGQIRESPRASPVAFLFSSSQFVHNLENYQKHNKTNQKQINKREEEEKSVGTFSRSRKTRHPARWIQGPSTSLRAGFSWGFCTLSLLSLSSIPPPVEHSRIKIIIRQEAAGTEFGDQSPAVTQHNSFP